jgi:hypothetical protein
MKSIDRGIANLQLVRSAVTLAEDRPWYISKDQTRFFVGDGKTQIIEPVVWKALMGRVKNA